MGKRSVLLLMGLLVFWARRPPASAQRRRVTSSSSEEHLPTRPARKCPRNVKGGETECGSFCSLRGPCPENELCCRYGCRQECLLPVEVNPGYCPKSNPTPTATCMANCTTDAQCGKGKKCCQWGCFSTCVEAEPAHPGVCPLKKVLRRDSSCRSSCQNDHDCLPEQKCCFTGCGLQCTDLEEDVCELPEEPGSCTSPMEYFYFNTSTMTCEKFQYSGCKGNANRFYTKEECVQVCGEKGTGETVKEGTCPECLEASGEGNVFCSEDGDCPGEMRCCRCGCGRKCLLPVGVNPGYCPKPSSNGITICLVNCTSDDKCGEGEKCCHWGCLLTCMPAEPEHTGICPQKEVLPSVARCENFCNDDRDCPSSQKCCFSGCGLKCVDPETDICKLPADTGPCKAYMPMYHYSSKTKTCKMFIYGGCGGNGNRFPTLEVCLSTCRYQDICKLPMEQGGCDSHKISFYYNYTSKTCASFTYRGCEGNENRFRTLEQCHSTCFYPEICKLPADPGRCRAHMPMYYYDHHNKSCVLFIYGGCDGNANRFPTLKECEQHCLHPDICVLPPETGPCWDYSGKYYYSPAEKKCLLFPYGGCDGNANRFPTVEECMETCSTKDICTLPPDPGPCLGYFPHYYYNPANKSCETFIYGGCGGNANRFESQKKCTWQCRNPDICKLPPETGPCRAALLRYYYNPGTKTCEIFSYGGCQGNDNRFGTLSECEHACRKPAICRLPMNPGVGDQEILMYYYDTIGTICEEFVYEGRGGNPNRFATLVECQETCRDPDICKLPKKSGPCEADIPRFYYDSTTGMCTNFSFGGCRPNPNNFLTKEDCQLTCKGPEKPGSCPLGEPPNCLVACQKDCECPGAQKCCSDSCGQVCKDPIKARPGSCPPAPAARDCLSTRSHCENDSECPDMEKCCSNGCGRACRKPIL